MAAAYCGYAFVGPITGLSGARLTLALGAYGLGALAGSIGSGQLTDRIGPTATLAFAYAVLAPATLLVAWRGPLPAVAGAALLWGAASWTQTPPQQKRLLGQRPSDATMVIGLNASALYLGIALGTSIGSVFIGVGRVTVVAAGAALAIVAAIVNAAVGRRDEARQWRVSATPEILTQPGYVSLAAADAPVREVFPGIRLRPLWTGPTGAHANVLEMDPGTRWPKTRHPRARTGRGVRARRRLQRRGPRLPGGDLPARPGRHVACPRDPRGMHVVPLLSRRLTAATPPAGGTAAAPSVTTSKGCLE
jgi:MFS family permease